MFKIKLSRSTNERAISKLDTLYIRSQNADNELKERKTKEKKNLEFKKHYDQTKNLDNTICSIEMMEWQPFLRHFFSCVIFKLNRTHIIKSSMNSFIIKPINISC